MGMARAAEAEATKKFNAETMQHIIRLYNTNIDGTKKVAFSMTNIKGIGMRFAKAIVLKAQIDPTKFAGEMTPEEIDKIQAIIADPVEYGIPEYFLNHQKNFTTGKSTQLVGVKLAGALRELIELSKKHKAIRGCRLAMGLKRRGQRTNANGRRTKAFGGKKK